ncbi:hypothetical protein HDU91_005177, partial [Kappamyces sp. JEL0680]
SPKSSRTMRLYNAAAIGGFVVSCSWCLGAIPFIAIPFWLRLLTLIGPALFSVLVAVYDNWQSYWIMFLAYKFRVFKKSVSKQAFFQTTVQLVLTSILDWVGIAMMGYFGYLSNAKDELRFDVRRVMFSIVGVHSSLALLTFAALLNIATKEDLVKDPEMESKPTASLAPVLLRDASVPVKTSELATVKLALASRTGTASS